MNPKTWTGWLALALLGLALGSCGNATEGIPFTCIDQAEGMVCYHYTGEYFATVDPVEFCADLTHLDGAVCDDADALGYCDLEIAGQPGTRHRLYLYPAYGDAATVEEACTFDLGGTWTPL